MSAVSEAISRAVIACAVVWTAVGLVVVVWNGWDHIQGHIQDRRRGRGR